MKNRIRLTESDLHKIVKESVNRILTETYGIDYEDTLRWVQKKKPNMSPQEQERFARNIINKQQKSNSSIQDGEYIMQSPQNAGKWWVLHVYYGIFTTKEKHYTVFSEEEANRIYEDWHKWALKMSKKYNRGYWNFYSIEAYEVENPNHSENKDDWYYSHWSPTD